MTNGTMIDSTGESLPGLLAALGSNSPDTFATYVTGSGIVPATSSDLSELAARAGLFTYDQTPELETFGVGGADGADIEAQAGTFVNVVTQTVKREARGWYSWWYFSSDSLDQARQLATSNGFKRVQYIVANWALSQSEAVAFMEANSDVSAVQWASPSSNPNTICPGTNRTLGELGVDLNVTRPGWFVKSTVTTAPAPNFKGVVVLSDLSTVAVTSNDKKTWSS